MKVVCEPEGEVDGAGGSESFLFFRVGGSFNFDRDREGERGKREIFFLGFAFGGFEYFFSCDLLLLGSFGSGFGGF